MKSIIYNINERIQVTVNWVEKKNSRRQKRRRLWLFKLKSHIHIYIY